MFWGGYNRGRQAAGGIGNWYAVDAALCSSGQRHEPKYSHYQALHRAITSVASTLLSGETALGKEKPVEVLTKDEEWVFGSKQRRFDYTGVVDRKTIEFSATGSTGVPTEISFIENDENEAVVVRIPVGNDVVKYREFTLSPRSAILVIDGVLAFDAGYIDPKGMSFKREFAQTGAVPELVGWSFWPEPIGTQGSGSGTRIDDAPIEQTTLNVGSSVWSDYAWYETYLSIETTGLNDAKLYVESQRSNGLLVFVDDLFVGSGEDHSHYWEGNFTINVNIGKLSKGKHKLSILSESMGYSNLVGRFGNSGTGPKHKGITGQVLLSQGKNMKNISLVDGREWSSFPGLHGEKKLDEKHFISAANEPTRNASPTWASVLFKTPGFNPANQSLFVQLTVGRGHFWLNGKDLGRYWNITQGETSKYSQEYYFLPIDYLRTDGVLNEIVIFDATGGSIVELQNTTKLVLSWITPSDSPNFEDEVSYPLACI
uniref:Beta-galactosidase galactose-binding domain-containing protein n=1 Tax=Pseudo-nitzschia multistriata TaxID=183589 RepID=A0A448Z1T4_9STRA